MGRSKEITKKANELRALAAHEEWSDDKLADRIIATCGISSLEAHRRARGWTLRQLADELNRRRRSARLITTTMLSQYERGQYTPGQPITDLLCQVYTTRPDRLGLGTDYTDNRPEEPLPSVRRAAPRAAARVDEGLMNELDDLMNRLGGTLRKETADSAIAHLERRVSNYDALFRVGTSGGVMIDVARDVRDAHGVLEGDHTPDNQRRLLVVMAKLSAMLGISLLHLGDVRAADQWLHMAELAADRTEDRELRGWVAARQALIPLYYGNRQESLDLATKALHLAGTGTRSVAVARAEIIRSRVLAQTPGQRNAALHAAEHARRVHSELAETETADGILGLTHTQMAGHLGEIYTHVGRTADAFEQQAIVLDRVSGTSEQGCLEPDGCLDVTLTRLQRATGYGFLEEYDEACQEATQAILAIPSVCCTLMVRQEARAVARTMPDSVRSTRAYRELTEVLAGFQ